MISRVPGYGHLQYLILINLIDLITLFKEIVGLLMIW